MGWALVTYWTGNVGIILVWDLSAILLLTVIETVIELGTSAAPFGHRLSTERPQLVPLIRSIAKRIKLNFHK